MEDDQYEPYQYSDNEDGNNNYAAPHDSDNSDEITKSLNAIVLQYLNSCGLHSTARTFIEECTECELPLPDGAEQRSCGNSNFSVQDVDFLLNAFDEYDGELLWQLWKKLASNFDLSTANEYTRTSFNVRLFVSLIPFYNDSSIEERSDSMTSLRVHFDEKTNSNAVDEETLSLFALPYVTDPKSHPIFKKLFEQSWKDSVKDSIIKACQVFQEKNKLASQSQTDLSQMFINCSGLVDEVRSDEGSHETCDMCSCKIARSRTATLNFTSGAHISSAPYSEGEAKSTVVGTNGLLQRVHHLTEENKELYKELRKDGERYLQLMKVSNRLVQSLELAVLGKSLDLIQLKQDVETAIPGIFVGIPLDKQRKSQEAIAALQSAESSRANTAGSGRAYENYNEPELKNLNSNNNTGDINVNVKLVLEGYDEEGNPYDFEAVCESDIPEENYADSSRSNHTNNEKVSNEKNEVLSYRTTSSAKSQKESGNDSSQLRDGNESSPEIKTKSVRKIRSKKVVANTEVVSDQESPKVHKKKNTVKFIDMNNHDYVSETEAFVRESSREVQVKANKIRRISDFRNHSKKDNHSKQTNTKPGKTDARSMDEIESARSLKQFDSREKQLLDNPGESFTLEALAPQKEHSKYRRSIPDPTVESERSEKNIRSGGNMTYRMEEQISARKSVAPRKRDTTKDRPIISTVVAQSNKAQSESPSKMEKTQPSKPVARKRWNDQKPNPEPVINPEPKHAKEKERSFNKVTTKILAQSNYLKNNVMKNVSHQEHSPRLEKTKLNPLPKESPKHTTKVPKKQQGTSASSSTRNPDSERVNNNKNLRKEMHGNSGENRQGSGRASTRNSSTHSNSSIKPSPSKIKPFQWISASKYDLPLPAQSNHNHSTDAGFVSRPRVPRSP